MSQTPRNEPAGQTVWLVLFGEVAKGNPFRSTDGLAALKSLHTADPHKPGNVETDDLDRPEDPVTGTRACNGELNPIVRSNGRDKVAVRKMVKQTCDADNPLVSGFCLEDIGDWATKEKQKQLRRAALQSSGQYMTDYCPRGYIPDSAKTGRLSWMSWSEINEIDDRSF